MKDPYIYEETGTLKNKLGITDYDKLRQFEADMGFLKLINVDSVKAKGFNEDLIKRIHKHIFEDIFDWAGEFRKINIEKPEIVLNGWYVDYSDYTVISKELKKCLDDLNSTDWSSYDRDKLCLVFARKIARIWKVHPFRDGNTRTILSFAYIFAKANGFPFDISLFAEGLNREYFEDGDTVKIHSVRDKFVVACLDDTDNPQVGPLAYFFRNAMIVYEKNNTK